ncbi:MAG TPA: TetR family transcriptional regulator [Gammaproteobacteria bacterium]|nr:TetR family transcriptional regulator [Gammaproteobacteria bacterium]
MMNKGQQTQEKIISATLDLIERQGFHSTGLQQIIKASGAPKGSLYFHFPNGKDEIVADALKQGSDLILAMIEQAFTRASDAQQAVGTLFDGLIQRLTDSEFEKGCPVATTALEAREDHPIVAAACRDAYTCWTQALINGLVRTGLSATQAQQEATLMLSLLEGALMLSKVQYSTAPLAQAREATLARLPIS